MSRNLPLFALFLMPVAAVADGHATSLGLTYGPHPAYLVDKLPDGALKKKLVSCSAQTPAKTAFSIGHRGAPLMYPEHTVESNVAAARMGAGVLECDVTFTKDHELVCRHAQNDLHTTTNILVSELAPTCITPFAAAQGEDGANAECRTSELTLAEFNTLIPKMDSADKTALTAEAYQGGVPPWRTQLYSEKAALMTHADSIKLFKSLGTKFTPELKSAAVEMPHNGFTQGDYAQKLVDEYIAADVPASDVFAQSFNIEDIYYWIDNTPEFGAQAVYLVQWTDGFNEQTPETWLQDFDALKARGVNYISASLNMLMTNANGKIAASAYAKAAKAADITLIAWTLERSGPLATGGGWYFQSVGDIVKDDSDYLVALDVLAQDVGVVGVFSDWPATVTYYANCMGL